jgi:hypothetical protein
MIVIVIPVPSFRSGQKTENLSMEMRRRHQEFLVARGDPPTRIIVIRAGYQAAGKTLYRKKTTRPVHQKQILSQR